MFKFTEAISFVIDCADQAEVDHYWTSLTAGGGEPGQCGWLKDKFGLPWQVTPRRLIELASSSDRAQATRVMEAMMGMTKIDIARLESAAKGWPQKKARVGMSRRGLQSLGDQGRSLQTG